MRRTVHIDELRERITLAQQALLQEKADILDLIPSARLDNREEYAFAYIRAERYGLKAIMQRLAGLYWLPLHVDPSPELLGKKRSPLNRWINSYAAFEPDAVDFGNDFMHILTRAALRKDWDSPLFLHTASRIARLFHDLSCLLNAAYFLTLLAENGVETVAINLSDDLLQIVTEMTRIVEYPELYVLSRGRQGSSRHAQKRPHLHVIKPDHDPHHSGRTH